MAGTQGVVGVRLFGQRQIIFARSEGVNVALRQPVAIEIAGAIEAGEIVIAPEQFQERQLPEPAGRVVRALTENEARAAHDARTTNRADGRSLLESLNLPGDALRSMGVLNGDRGEADEVEH